MKKLIAFCGSKESGKSTSGTIFKKIISDEFQSLKVEELSFANHLKETCSKVFSLEMKYFLDTKLKESELETYIRLTKNSIEDIFREFEVSEFDYDLHVRPHVGRVFDTPRKVLQYVGTELLQPLDKLIHVKIAIKKVNKNSVTIITDLRFPHEFDYLKTLPEFLPVYIDNKKAENLAKSDSHASERGWQTFKDRCVAIDNNGTLSDLTLRLTDLVKKEIQLGNE